MLSSQLYFKGGKKKGKEKGEESWIEWKKRERIRSLKEWARQWVWGGGRYKEVSHRLTAWAPQGHGPSIRQRTQAAVYISARVECPPLYQIYLLLLLLSRKTTQQAQTHRKPLVFLVHLSPLFFTLMVVVHQLAPQHRNPHRSLPFWEIIYQDALLLANQSVCNKETRQVSPS